MRRICVVTGTRAEYGQLYWLMKEIALDPELELQVVATGTHLAPEFGQTFRQIEADGFEINAKLEMLLSSDTTVGVAKSMGLATIGLADALDRLKPEVVVLLGDRFECLAAAQVALVARITIAHIHGGEATEGAIDDAIRNAITKLANYHFVAAPLYRKRVIQMGEAPERVFTYGAPGLDYVTRTTWLDRGAIERALGMSLRKPLFLITYHPATLGRLRPVDAMANLLGALDRCLDATVVFTYPNADTGGRALIDQINSWVAANSQRATARASLGQELYLSLMREADVVIGNSSSGLTEAPMLKKAVVNIGDRQKGRLKATSVIDTPEELDPILQAIGLAQSEEFQRALANTESLYGHGDVSRRIKDMLKTIPLTVRKRFFDVDLAD